MITCGSENCSRRKEKKAMRPSGPFYVTLPEFWMEKRASAAFVAATLKTA